MIKLHHLNKSRSKRIIWLLEELGVEYQIIAYQRDAVTSLAPEALKKIHDLGKSPVIELDGRVISESGAITEYLIEQYAADTLAPDRNSADYIDYLQWLHFAESSAILPLLLKMFIDKDGCETNFVGNYADNEISKVISYVEQALDGKTYFVGDRLSGADIMMSFIVEIIESKGLLKHFDNIAKYANTLKSHQSYLKAEQIELEHSTN